MTATSTDKRGRRPVGHAFTGTYEPTERMVLRCTYDLIANVRASDGTFDPPAAILSPGAMVELAITIGTDLTARRILEIFDIDRQSVPQNFLKPSRLLSPSKRWRMTMRASRLINRNVNAQRGRTSMRLEPELWDALEEICARESLTMAEVIRQIESLGHPGGRTSAVRVHLLGYYRRAASESGHRAAGHGSPADPTGGRVQPVRTASTASV